MSELHPKLAKAKAQTALLFLSAFDGEDFGVMREDSPGPYDRRHLAIALDHIQELGAMVLNLADRATPNTLREQNAAWWALVMGAAAALEDAAHCLSDTDAKKAAEGAAKHYRTEASALMTPNAALTGAEGVRVEGTVMQKEK